MACARSLAPSSCCSEQQRWAPCWHSERLAAVQLPFSGPAWLRIAQLIPLATPAYLLSAILVDLGSRHSWTIHGMGWGIAVMALTTYPYVFLLSTESFSVSGQRQLEACRSLGVGPWSAFRRVALPIALPAIGAGVALMGMEVVNELGAVQLLGIRVSPQASWKPGSPTAIPQAPSAWP